MKPQLREDLLVQEGLEEIRENTAAEAAEEARFKAECNRADELERENYSAYLDSRNTCSWWDDDDFDDRDSYDDSYDFNDDVF